MGGARILPFPPSPLGRPPTFSIADCNPEVISGRRLVARRADGCVEFIFRDFDAFRRADIDTVGDAMVRAGLSFMTFYEAWREINHDPVAKRRVGRSAPFALLFTSQPKPVDYLGPKPVRQSWASIRRAILAAAKRSRASERANHE